MPSVSLLTKSPCPMPEFYIHCGLHKTGTTALQHFVAKNAQALLDAGLHYPSSGTSFGAAHHNLAWELSRDRRFTRKLGTLEDMLRQTSWGGRDTMVSSEDFETSLLTPERWSPLVEALRGLGYNVTFVVYLRDQASYLRSLYLENVKHDCGDEFSAVARSAIERGVYSLRDWTFCFDYDLIGRQLSRVPNARVVFRSFERLVGGSIVPDFFALLGRPVPASAAVPETDQNVAADTRELLGRFLLNRHFMTMPPIEHSLAVVDLLLGGRRPVPRVPERLAAVLLKQRDSAIKRQVDAASPPRPSERRRDSGDWVVNISRLFSWETQVEVSSLYDQAPGEGEEKLRYLATAGADSLQTWRDWVAGGL